MKYVVFQGSQRLNMTSFRKFRSAIVAKKKKDIGICCVANTQVLDFGTEFKNETPALIPSFKYELVMTK